MKEVNLTQEERTDLAEFMFGIDTDILIKDDVRKALNILREHNLTKELEHKNFIAAVDMGIPGTDFAVKQLIQLKISSEQGKSIMNEYFGR